MVDSAGVGGLERKDICVLLSSSCLNVYPRRRKNLAGIY
jgi:hypothetical protein